MKVFVDINVSTQPLFRRKHWKYPQNYQNTCVLSTMSCYIGLRITEKVVIQIINYGNDCGNLSHIVVGFFSLVEIFLLCEIMLILSQPNY